MANVIFAAILGIALVLLTVSCSELDWDLADVLDEFDILRRQTLICSSEKTQDCARDVKDQYDDFVWRIGQHEKKEKSPEKYFVVQPVKFMGKCCPKTTIKYFLKMADKMIRHNKNRNTKLQFTYLTDMNSRNQRLMTNYNLKFVKAELKLTELAKSFDVVNETPKTKRLFKFLTASITSSDPKIQRKFNQLKGSLENKYGHAQVCVDGMKCLTTGEIGVENFFSNSTDYEDLKNVWKAWRDVTGPIMKDDFTKMVKTRNIGARENRFSDAGHYEWFHDTEDPKFNTKVVHLYNQIAPLYKQLHAYVRYRLLKKYPNKFPADGPIPAHILGNVWAQQFEIIDLVLPYPDAQSSDVTKTLKNLHLNGDLSRKEMFKMAENFFTSIGLEKMTNTFWRRSVIKQRKNKIMQCHGSASFFENYWDYRIKMCTNFEQKDFKTIHHEMGHIQYFMAYHNQPAPFLNGANSGFHEAIGDTIALSATTPEHFKTIGLQEQVPTSQKFDINYLMRVALEKVAFIPFGLTVDTWRWNVFNGSITPDTYNKEWWNIRSKLQGIMPPVPRTKNDVDALSKYHIAVNIPYIRYFMSFFMQFQFYSKLCERSGYSGALHRCDFYDKDIGPEFKKMLSLGASKPWPEAMQLMTGQPEILADSILEYFRPLQRWLEKENKRHGNHIGWNIPKMPVQ